MSRVKMDARELFLKFSLVSVNFLALLSISLFSRTGDCDGVCFSPVGSGRQQQRTTSPSLVEPKCAANTTRTKVCSFNPFSSIGANILLCFIFNKHSKITAENDALYPATRYLITSTDMDGAESMDYFTMGVRTPRTLLAALSTPPLLEKSEAESLQKNIECNKCGRMYKLKSSLLNHQRWECGKDPQFKCTLCDYKAKQKAHLLTHIKYRHKHD
ncbi:unnamed protein product [Bemisia tabaci]|uniref:C2H2-type domain-containing protein n=1 Tax=Bemisia tabaci TaxID=7038 RepID=A0A9N9ZX64_BEMTA|nr:unnamed protein product [Bemisia tabaci]